MLKNGVVTVFTTDSQNERFVKRGVFDAWVYRKKRLRTNENGVYCRDSFDVRINLSLVEEIIEGDMIYFGQLDEEDFAVEKCRRIAVVGKNCFGANPHWHLQAEYDYR